MPKREIQIVVSIAAAVLLFAVLPGCPMAEDVEGCDELVEGEVYEIELQILEGDVLYAVEAEQDGEDEDCDEEGEDDEDDEEDDDEDCDDDDADDDEEDEEMYEITAQVTAVADDFSSFELLGTLTVEVESDGEIEIAIEDLEVGTWVEVEGEFEGGVFEAEELEPADEEETEIAGVLLDLTDTSFTMAGLTITYDDATEIECDEEDDDDDDDNEDDDDDDDDEEDDDEEDDD